MRHTTGQGQLDERVTEGPKSETCTAGAPPTGRSDSHAGPSGPRKPLLLNGTSQFVGDTKKRSQQPDDSEFTTPRYFPAPSLPSSVGSACTDVSFGRKPLPVDRSNRTHRRPARVEQARSAPYDTGRSSLGTEVSFAPRDDWNRASSVETDPDAPRHCVVSAGTVPHRVTNYRRMTYDNTVALDGLLRGPQVGADGMAPNPVPGVSRLAFLKHLPQFIARKLARQDYRAVRSALQLTPLRFRVNVDEMRYFQHLLPAYGFRIRLSAYIGGAVFVSFWLVCSIMIHTGVYPVSRSLLNVILFHAVMFLVTGVIGSYYFLGKQQALQPHLELILYIVTFLVVISPFAWVLTATVATFTETRTLLERGESPTPSSCTTCKFGVEPFKLWTMPFFLGIPLWNSVLINLFMQTRTRISIYPQLVVLFLLIGFNVCQATLGSQTIETYYRIFVKGAISLPFDSGTSIVGEKRDSSFFIIVACLECWSLICVFCMCYFGRWNLELQERIEFWKYTKSNDHLCALRESQARPKKKSGLTAVEDLLHVMIRAMTNVQEAEVTTGHDLLVESTDLLRQIQEVLTNTEDLYAVKLQPRSSETLNGEARNAQEERDEESALLEAQFYEIYANKGGVTKKRSMVTTEAPSETESPTKLGTSTSTSANIDAKTREKTDESTVAASAPDDRDRAHPRASSIKIRSFAPLTKATAAFRRGVGREWNCNILRGSREYSHILVEVGALLLESKSGYIHASPICIRNYVYRLERLYRVNPYHNSAHGAMVAHSMMCFLKMLNISNTPIFSHVDAAGVIIAALGHDAGHPGRNNQFYVNSFQKMALLYNDKSVLENYHTALVFKSFEWKHCNILDNLSAEVYRDLRKKIIELILATDMGQHFESVSKFRLRRKAAGFDFLQDVEDMWLVIRMCIKCADLSHALVDWSQHQEWSLRVVEEFYQQGEEEVLLGLTLSPLCDRNQHDEFAKSQKGFIEFVVQPLMTQMEELDTHNRIAENCLKHLAFNKYKWEEMYRDKRLVAIPHDVQSIRTDSHACRYLLMHLFVPKGYKMVTVEDDLSPFDQAEREDDAYRSSLHSSGLSKNGPPGDLQNEKSTPNNTDILPESLSDARCDAFSNETDDEEDLDSVDDIDTHNTNNEGIANESEFPTTDFPYDGNNNFSSTRRQSEATAWVTLRPSGSSTSGGGGLCGDGGGGDDEWALLENIAGQNYEESCHFTEGDETSDCFNSESGQSRSATPRLHALTTFAQDTSVLNSSGETPRSGGESPRGDATTLGQKPGAHVFRAKKPRHRNRSGFGNATPGPQQPVGDTSFPQQRLSGFSDSERSHLSAGSKASNSPSHGNAIDGKGSNQAPLTFHSPSMKGWGNERSSTLETARFGGDSFAELIDDEPISRSSYAMSGSETLSNREGPPYQPQQSTELILPPASNSQKVGEPSGLVPQISSLEHQHHMTDAQRSSFWDDDEDSGVSPSPSGSCEAVLQKEHDPLWSDGFNTASRDKMRLGVQCDAGGKGSSTGTSTDFDSPSREHHTSGALRYLANKTSSIPSSAASVDRIQSVRLGLPELDGSIFHVHVASPEEDTFSKKIESRVHPVPRR